ncbi:EamA/RhaT family transporter, type 1 [Arcobacter venerupis]|uniref:EamA/RhaT family transporter, type 1 n=2 Tax=Arcobacter venerupis TaxID=1054033 RepID=A0AAE7BCD1_9BACT|nr:EamA/RhaT family transporter, type 1 [Arcobacter venerupis]RWS49228.1 EamA family transporter [Arcobacter venerupis]
MLISSICLSFMSAIAKILSNHLPIIEIVFFRNFIGIILILMTFFKSPLNQSGGKPLLLFFRATVGLIAMLSFFYNIANITLADAVIYSRMSPIFTAIFALWFLREKIGIKGWFAIFIGFVGMLMVMQPNGLIFEKAHIFGLLNAVCAALAFTSIRELRSYYDTRTIVLSFMGIGTIVPIISMFLSAYYQSDFFSFMMGEFIMPNLSDWIYIFAMGLTASLGQVYMTKAYGVTRAGIVGATGYSVIVFSLIIGLILGDALPNILGFIGILAIISGGILIAREKN